MFAVVEVVVGWSKLGQVDQSLWNWEKGQKLLNGLFRETRPHPHSIRAGERHGARSACSNRVLISILRTFFVYDVSLNLSELYSRAQLVIRI